MLSPEIASAPERRGASDLIGVLRDRAPRAAMALAAGQVAWPAVSWARGWVRDRLTYTVKVNGSDELYDPLHEWVLTLLPATRQRALVAWSSRHGDYPVAESGHPAPAPAALRLRYDGSRQQDIRVAGHKISVCVTDGSGGEEGRRWTPPEITFTASSPAGRDALLEHIAGVLRASHAATRKPSFRMLDQWGDWVRLDDLPARDLDSVILPDGQMEQLRDDIARWLAAEQDYTRRCIPWHRGHLYAGPPGTGKTSVARALASHFGMDVWYLPLADVEKDGELLRIVGRIGKRSMLLLEDADVFHAATERDDDRKVTLSGLLNTLDGIATPHGLLTVLTTNVLEALDPALIRPGRIDLTEHFTLAGPEQVDRLVAHYYGVPLEGGKALAGEFRDIAPAEVIEVCKRHDRPQAAFRDLYDRMLTQEGAGRGWQPA